MRDRTPCSRIVVALWNGDAEIVVDFIRERLGIEAAIDHAKEWCKLFDPKRRLNCWSDGTALMWLKNRLATAGYFNPPIGQGTPTLRVFCEMHCFFMYLEETPEQRAKLAREDIDKCNDRLDEARSRITKTMLANLNPINRTAANVMQDGKDSK